MKGKRLAFGLMGILLALTMGLTAAAQEAEDGILTRGEFVAGLFEMSGAEAFGGSCFDDVTEGDPLSPAVCWAAENGIVNGYGDGRFGPDDPVTKEQMAAMLYRNARYLGEAPEGEWLFPLGFADAGEISPWADEAVQWAVMNRILDSGSELGPGADMTDDMLPVVLGRFRSFLDGRGIMILYTGDVHCGIDENFGYAGLWEIKNALTAQGYDVLLADVGDSIQGEPVSTLTKGAAVTELMNALGYDAAIPGNHEFDYGMDVFLSLAENTDFPYVSCNFVHSGEIVFEPYVICGAGGKKIAFVGVTTPQPLTSSTPAYFRDENGEFVYGFLQDDTGEGVYRAVQEAADAARADGADYVIVLAHLGNEAVCAPWTYADVISHTTGIDALLDGHSHDTDQVVMKNAAGAPVPRSASGTKTAAIGWCSISSDGTVETGLYSWNREGDAREVLGLDNPMAGAVAEVTEALNETIGKVVAHTDVTLTITDPEAVDEAGKPIRIVRRMETNLGDLIADAFRDQSGADIGLENGGSIRTSIAAGGITMGDILSVQPFGNAMCMIEATGQQILDALEWGARSVPGETGAFLQVSGLSYEIHSYIPSPCVADENGMFAGMEGERRVKNVLVGGEPIDPEKTYTLASHDYMLLAQGDGFTMFDGAPLLLDCVKLDNQLLIDFIVDTLGGVIGEEYADPYGQGRIGIVEKAE